MTAIIEARDLVKRFDGLTAVDHISFAVPEGVIFGFLGPNGAGKTTTIKMLTTVLEAERGSALDRRPRPGQGPAPGAPRLRHRVPGSEPRRRTDGGREHGIARRPLSRAAGRAPRARRGAATLRRPVGAARRLRQALLGRHEAPARNRPRAAAPAAHPVPRRADRRARPADPQSDLGIHPRARAATSG